MSTHTNKDQKQDMQKKFRRTGNTDKTCKTDTIWKNKNRLEKDMYRRNKRKPFRDTTTKDCYDFLVKNDDN